MKKPGVCTRNRKLKTRPSGETSPISDFRFSSFDSRPPAPERRTLIIAYGNPVRGDDGFGWHAARMLTPVVSGEHAEVITCHQLTPEVAEPLSRSSCAVFIDADCQDTPGEIHYRELRPEPAAPQSFTHTCTPGGLLASAERLYGHRPWASEITVSARTFDFGDTLSAEVAAALPIVVERVRQLAAVANAAEPDGK